MGKRIFITLSLLNLILIFVFLGYSQASSASDIRGVLTRHYGFLEAGDYQGAYSLFTEKSKNYLTVDQFREFREQVGLESSRLFRVYQPQVKDNLGVVCFVIFNRIRGAEYPLFNVGFMRYENGKWALVGDIRELPVSLGLDVFTLMVRAEDAVKKDKAAFAGLTEEQQDSLRKQLEASYAECSAFLKAYQIYEERKNHPPKENTRKKAYQEVTEEDVGLHGGF